MVNTLSSSPAKVRWLDELVEEEMGAAGGKGASLARLRQAGLPVPDGFVVLPSAFAEDALLPEAWDQVRARLEAMRATEPAVAFAVRSSAASEDSAQASFAGEFTTILDARTDDDVRAAIEKVRASRHNDRVAAYSQARGLRSEHSMTVVVQRLVPAECSGILFTANPVSGRREEAVISAAWGLGEAIVGGLVTPDTLTISKEDGRVLVRETADKQVMTVRHGGGTAERPVPEDKRRVAVLSDAQAFELAKIGTRIEALYGVPVDVEWAMSGGQLAIVQARPITALPEPESAPPSEWVLPKGAYAAMRNNIVELMAEPLSPLFRTFGLAAVNASLHRVLAAFFGRQNLMPAEIIIAVNGYAYFNGSLGTRQILALLWQSIGVARRMFKGAIARWLDAGRSAYVAVVDGWRSTRWQELPATSLLHAARELTEAAVEAFGVLDSGVIPGAWISEGLFTFVYNRLVKRRGDPPAATYLLGYDSAPIRGEKSLYDLAVWARGRPDLAAYLERTPAARITAALEDNGAPAGVPDTEWREWRNRFQAHLREYGHTIYNLDFANPVPADAPVPLLETCKMYLTGGGADPRARQQAAAVLRERATAALATRAGGWRLRLCRQCLASAQRYAQVREDGQAEIGLGYPLLRQALGELGRRCAEAGMIAKAEDVYWLEEDELTTAARQLDQGQELPSMMIAVVRRKAERRAAQRATPPQSIVQLRFLGLKLGRTKKPRSRRREGSTLKGVAASGGRVTATASVITNAEDFDHMRTGDVLVAPLTTPAWTPLFARASAIVTDVGGPLSHGSIVAREYGIPAVLGTGEATKRIRSGQVVTVDGDAGTVQLQPE